MTSSPQIPVIRNVRDFGAVGDGIAVDSEHINKAIETASAAGGGTVYFPPGNYLSFSIRLKSHVTLHLDRGAIILAADPILDDGAYDPAEPNPWDAYQDFGHSHWHNSLIWGEGLTNISIVGSGLIHGEGLARWGPGPTRAPRDGDSPLSLDETPSPQSEGSAPPLLKSAYGAIPSTSRGFAPPGFTDEPLSMEGQGNKAIALKLCSNVLLRDFSILKGGHFAVLATGVENLTIDNLTIDTNRDGIDIDCCRNVRILNTRVNSPNDDGICLKSSFALGGVHPTEDVTVSNCRVTGYDPGTFLDGSLGRTQEAAPDKDGLTGRIKCGTESNGGFRRITISDCHCERSRGIALETVDGGVMEDISISNIVMNEVTTSPLFLRLGNRGRGPEGTGVGAIRRVSISNIVALDVDHRYASILAGLPGHPIEDVVISNVRIVYRGGGTAEDASLRPEELEKAYPEPSMFGTIPSYGFYVRHVENLHMSDVEMSYEEPEARPPMVLDDVHNAFFERVKARRISGPCFVLRNVTDFESRNCNSLPDTALKEAPDLEF